MSIDGVWSSEVYGPFGWEARGVFVLERGRILGGDSRQYTVGRYELTEDNVHAELRVHYYGPPRTMFGEAVEQFDSRLEGRLQDGTIEGTIARPDKRDFEVQIRLTKRMDLPDI